MVTFCNISINVDLLCEVPQQGCATAPEVRLQVHSEPLLIVSGLGYLTSQEPEQEVTDSFVLRWVQEG